MKKFAVLLIAAACFLSVNAQADSIQETWFNTFFSELKKNLEPGITAKKYSDGQHRVIFINMPIPYDSKQPFDIQAAKKAIVDSVKGSVDEDFLKKMRYGHCLQLHNH